MMMFMSTPPAPVALLLLVAVLQFSCLTATAGKLTYGFTQCCDGIYGIILARESFTSDPTHASTSQPRVTVKFRVTAVGQNWMSAKLIL